MKPEIFHADKADESEKMSQNSFFFTFDPFMVKMQSEKYFCKVLLKRFKQKINELESESKFFAFNERQSWKI